jgi:Helix-turn-helix domain
MSSQTSIRRDVNKRPNSFRADAPASAPAPQSIDSASANSATKAISRPMARAERNGEILAIPARGLTQPMPMTVGKMLTTREAAAVLGRPHSTLERWRCEGRGPDYVKEEGGVRYYEDHLREYIRRNTRTSSVRALVETKRESL